MRRRRLASLLVVAAIVTGVPSASVLEPPSAEAAVSIAYSLSQLVKDSSRVVVARAVERRSEWAEVAGSRRIVTYTRLQTLESVLGDGPADLWVRTLGGVVGRVGQQVSGEASLELDGKSMVFLARATDGAWVVTGMAQGHYPVRHVAEGETSRERLTASREIGTVVARKSQHDFAHARLIGRTLEEAVTLVRAVKHEGDAAPR